MALLGWPDTKSRLRWARRRFRMSLARLRLRHGQRSADADPRSLDVAGSDPPSRHASIGIGDDGDGHPHRPLRCGVAPSQQSLREGCRTDEALDAPHHRGGPDGGHGPRVPGAVSGHRREPRAGPDRLPRPGPAHGDPRLVLRGASRRLAARRQRLPLGLEGLARAAYPARRSREAARLAHLARRRGALARRRRTAPSDRAARERAAVVARRPREGALHRHPHRRGRRHRQDHRLHVPVRPTTALLAGRRAGPQGGRARARSQGGFLPPGPPHPGRRRARGRLPRDRTRRLVAVEPARRSPARLLFARLRRRVPHQPALRQEPGNSSASSA